MKKALPILLAACLWACSEKGAEISAPKAFIESVSVNGAGISDGGVLGDIDPESVTIDITFNKQPSDYSLPPSFRSSRGSWTAGPGTDRYSVRITPSAPLELFCNYSFAIVEGEAFGLNVLDKYSFSFTTAYDPAPKFPEITDDELLTLVQKRTFKYFWDYAHPVSGLARERLGSGETVTAGGSGFGVMAIPVGIERGFITREEGAERLRTIARFLAYSADRFHGAFPHWMNGTSGKVIPFGQDDDGGDLVETAFLLEGLLTAREYFDRDSEADIRAVIDNIWDSVEWDWYLHGQEVLYWHWSPSAGWAMNMPIRGWNEALMVYVLAASSPTHPVSADVYHEGWASGGGMKPSVDGPLFFAHYSFLGLDPRGLSDDYCADYFAHNRDHALYNYNYCVRNPKGHAGYSAASWGLTASDIPGGYAASSPSNDRGTIAPTAALASLPYTPEESMAALHTFYYIYGDRLWGDYGFFDAFSLDSAWFASSCIAIDQGPIVVMIENYRSALLWNLFMQHPDIPRGLSALGFRR